MWSRTTTTGDEVNWLNFFQYIMAVSVSLICPGVFMYDDESRHTAGTRWPQWLRDFELFLVGSGVVDEGQKKAILLYVVGSAAREVYYTLKKDDDDDV